jgi:hypothetical protein
MDLYEKYPSDYLLWRKTMSGSSVETETKFIIDCFKKSNKKIKTVIDLGGGIGLHSNLLQKAGFEVTIYDHSKKSLQIAKKTNPKLKTIQGSFENIKINKKFDAAICMWTTFTYIIDNKGRTSFFSWISTHIKDFILLDESNFYNFPKKLHKVYTGAVNNKKIKITRNWTFNKNGYRETIFKNEITDLKTNKKQIITDIEKMQFLSENKINDLLHKKWELIKTIGDYNYKTKFNIKQSPRLITLWEHE